MKIVAFAPIKYIIRTNMTLTSPTNGEISRTSEGDQDVVGNQNRGHDIVDPDSIAIHLDRSALTQDEFLESYKYHERHGE
jgi:hypothetical protein